MQARVFNGLQFVTITLFNCLNTYQIWPKCYLLYSEMFMYLVFVSKMLIMKENQTVKEALS
jgi:hypothetical protein